MTQPPLHVPDRHLDDQVRELDVLGQAIDLLRKDEQVPSAVTLAKQGPLRIVLLVLPRRSHVHEHRAAAPISVQVLFGHVRLNVAGREIHLTQGRVLVVARDLPHDLSAEANSAALLTMGGLP